MAFLRWSLIFALILSTAAHAQITQSEYHQRRIALGEKLNGGVAILFANYEPNEEYQTWRQDEDFYYLTGLQTPGAALIIIGPGPATTVPRIGTQLPAHEYREVLFLPERNLVTELYTGKQLDPHTPAETAKVTGFDDVAPIAEMPSILAKFIAPDLRRAYRLYAQLDRQNAKALLNFLAASFARSDAPLTGDISQFTTQLRMVKSSAEIELIRQATLASEKGQALGMKAIESDVLENTVAGVETAEWLKEGCQRPSYPPIVGSGPNSVQLHYSENNRVMKKGEVVVIDAACEKDMYASDITRTMPVSGKFTARQKEIYNIVLGAQQAAAAAFVAGKTRLGNINQRSPEVTDSLDKVAYDYINTHGKDLHGEPLGKYFIHGLGHHVGIDVHDPFDPAKPLDKGNVFTIEPGIYIPEENIGVRIEDVFYVDTDGHLVDLVASLPHASGDVEAAMH